MSDYHFMALLQAQLFKANDENRFMRDVLRRVIGHCDMRSELYEDREELAQVIERMASDALKYLGDEKS
jgi:two-component sensor histidine kinase